MPDAPIAVIPTGLPAAPSAPVAVTATGLPSAPSAPVSVTATGLPSAPSAPVMVMAGVGSIVVSGVTNPTDANGIYTESGSLNAYPKFIRVGEVATYEIKCFTMPLVWSLMRGSDTLFNGAGLPPSTMGLFFRPSFANRWVAGGGGGEGDPAVVSTVPVINVLSPPPAVQPTGLPSAPTAPVKVQP